MRIVTVFDLSQEVSHRWYSEDRIRSGLKRILPTDLFFQEEGAQFEEELKGLLPVVHSILQEGRYYSILLLCLSRPNVGRFFLDMASKWLLPGRQLLVPFFFTTDFVVASTTFTFSEIVIGPLSSEDLEGVRYHLPLVEAEIRLGAASVYHAKRILEIKGLSADEKTSLVQEQIVSLLKRRPQYFDYDIFHQMQHFLVMCRDLFKEARETHHLSRLITLFYLFRKEIRAHMEEMPTQRHLRIKMMQARVLVPFGIKKVLGVVVAVNFLKENELFEKEHLFAAIKRCLPGVVAIEESLLLDKGQEDKIQLIYLEVEKEGGQEISFQEISLLKEQLPKALHEHVQHLIRPVFMPRNEEEVMRNILTLGQQLKYLRDIPQVIISFEEQTDVEVMFTIVLARILFPDTLSIEEMLQEKASLEFSIDRVRKVGMVRKKYVKEGVVFRLKLSTELFLREDHSLDLYKARQQVLEELQQVFGEVRDYNGGMISKQIEALASLKELLEVEAAQHGLLLEKFFHAIFPVEMRSVLAPVHLKNLFLLFVHAKKGENDSSFFWQREKEDLFLLIPLSDPSSKQRVFSIMETLAPRLDSCAHIQIQMPEMRYLGYTCRCKDREDQRIFKALETLS